MKNFCVLIVIIFFASCGETLFCKAKTKNTGSIVQVFSSAECFNPRPNDHGEFVVKSLADLDTANCKPTTAPVDFRQHSIIGKSVKGGCNVRIISRNVTIHHTDKIYEYTVVFKDCGLCKRLGIINNMVIVPKIPNDYTVVFNVKEK